MFSKKPPAISGKSNEETILPATQTKQTFFFFFSSALATSSSSPPHLRRSTDKLGRCVVCLSRQEPSKLLHSERRDFFKEIVRVVSAEFQPPSALAVSQRVKDYKIEKPGFIPSQLNFLEISPSRKDFFSSPVKRHAARCRRFSSSTRDSSG